MSNKKLFGIVYGISAVITLVILFFANIAYGQTGFTIDQWKASSTSPYIITRNSSSIVIIPSLTSAGTKCLNVSASGTVGKAAADCGTGGSVTFLANGSNWFSSSTIDFQQGANITITTSTTGVITIAGSAGGGSGTVATSSRFAVNELVFVQGGANVMTTGTLRIASSTGLLENFAITSSTELLSPSGTIATFFSTNANITNTSGTNITLSGNIAGASLNISGQTSFASVSSTNAEASGYGRFPTLVFTNASGTNITASGYFTGATLNISGQSSLAAVSSTNLTASGNIAGASLNISGQTTVASVSSTNITASGYGTFPTLQFTSASGTQITASIQGTRGDLNNVSTTNIDVVTRINTPRITTTNVSSTNVDIGTLNGDLYGSNGRVFAATSTQCSAFPLGNLTPDGLGESFFDYDSNITTNDLMPSLVLRFGTSTALAINNATTGANGLFTLPPNFATTSAPYFQGNLFTPTTTAGNIVLGINYAIAADGETLDPSAFLQSVTTTIANKTTAFLRNSFTIGGFTAANFSTASNTIKFYFHRDRRTGTADNVSTTVAVSDLQICYATGAQ